MLRFSLEVTKMDKIRNEYMRGTAEAERSGDRESEAGMVWMCAEEGSWIYWSCSSSISTIFAKDKST